MRKVLFIVAAMMLLAGCGVDQKKYDAMAEMADSLFVVCNSLKQQNAAMQKELEGYKFNPAKLLKNIESNYSGKDYGELKKNLDLLQQYHPEAPELATANGLYNRGLKEQEAMRKKAEAEAAKREAERRAKMSAIEKIMEKYNCSQSDAELIKQGRVRLGMTAEQCRAAWGRPRDINRSVGSYGVHEQWCYNGSYLYFQDGVLTSWQN